MSEKMSNAPVYYALVQTHFNTVAMKKYVEDIQDQLRKQGYTLFEPLTTMQIKFAHAQGQQPVIPEVTQDLAWLITHPNKCSGFILGNSSLTFHTTHYDTHEEFFAELINALRVVHNVAQLDHVSRVGLRYLDAILPRPEETVDDYLTSGLHGIDFGPKRIQALHESIFQTTCGPMIPSGLMITRIHRRTGHLGFPPDLQPHNLTMMERFRDTVESEHAILDIDHYATGKTSLDLTGLVQQFESLHGALKGAFEAVRSEHAKQVWS